MADDISLVVGVDYKELTGFIKTSEQSKRVIKSVAQEFARTGDQKAYMSGIMRVVMAQKNLGKEAQLTQSKIMKLGAQMKQEAVFAEQLAKSTSRAGTAMRQTGRRTNQLGVLMQQSGYQIGDFAIQVQSGTNYMVAFGQQATQLVGTFAMLSRSTAMIGLFSGIGIALPILTAIGAYFVRAKVSAEDLTQQVGKLVSELLKIEDATRGIKDLPDYLESFTKGVMNRNLSELRSSSKGAFNDIITGFRTVAREAYVSGAVAKKAVQEILKAPKDMKEDLGKLFGGTAQELDKRFKAAQEVLAEINSEIVKIEDAFNQGTDTGEFASNIIKLRNYLVESGFAGTQTIEAIDEMIMSQGLFNAAVAHEKRLRDKEREAREVHQKKIEAYYKAEQELEEARHQASVDNILNEAALREATISLARAKFDLGAGQFAEASQDVAAQRLAELRKAYADSLKSATPAKESDLEKLQKQLDLEDALLGKTEARQRVIKALGVKFVEDNPKTVAGLEAQITANENLLRIEEERKRMNDLVTDSMEDGLMAMADGTKSVSDAFRDMAREIIADLYRVLVVQQMVNAAKSAMGFGFFADGGAFSGGSQIQAYADGGVVGGPTMFPMAGGKTGLMGEAGPEAIMPLKRGANGKLGVQMEGGGGDTINVVQNFNFQANGDDSVKKIIAQAAPQIANMTKKSLLDDRRRGGTTKAVFG
jgi:hypothetical protein